MDIVGAYLAVNSLPHSMPYLWIDHFLMNWLALIGSHLDAYVSNSILESASVLDEHYVCMYDSYQMTISDIYSYIVYYGKQIFIQDTSYGGQKCLITTWHAQIQQDHQ